MSSVFHNYVIALFDVIIVYCRFLVCGRCVINLLYDFYMQSYTHVHTHVYTCNLLSVVIVKILDNNDLVKFLN